MLTTKQVQKYWRTWAKIIAFQGWSHEPAARKDVRRKATHIMCGLKNADGTARSMKTFANRDFSRWLAATAHLCDEVDIRDRDRENALWRIENDAKKGGLDIAYIESMARELYNTTAWRDLSFDQLENLRDAIHNRAGKKIGHDTRYVSSQPRRKYTLDGGTRTFGQPVRGLSADITLDAADPATEPF